MTTKQSALEKIDAMKPEPKKRRTAQEVARAALVKERDRVAIAWKRATAKVNGRFAAKFADAERALQAFEKALSKDDEQAPESE